jgi:hypothetical protein
LSHVAEIEVPLPTRLRQLAGDLVRLQPSRTDPEAYHVAKSEIVEGLRRAAREADWIRPKSSAEPARARDRRHPVLPAVLRVPVLAAVIAAPAGLPAHCRHCRRRRAQQSYRRRLRLPAADLFQWAATRDA